jgi:hypothetical protein
MTATATDPSKAIRDFIRGNATLAGALDALDALRALEDAATAAVGARAREDAYSAAIVAAQKEIQPAYKNKFVSKQKGGGPVGPNTPGMKVAETQQILDLAREVMASHGLALEVGDLQIVDISGAAFLRVRYGLRHVLGYVHSVSRDFPLGHGATNPDVVRGANTSALGYFLIDAFALPRREADSLESEAERRRAQGSGGATTSGPRRAAQGSGTRTAPSAPAASSEASAGTSASSAPPSVNQPPAAARVVAKFKSMATEKELDEAAAWVDGHEFEFSEGRGTYDADEIAEMKKTIRERRAEVGV